jgi:hypothetical protein
VWAYIGGVIPSRPTSTTQARCGETKVSTGGETGREFG